MFSIASFRYIQAALLACLVMTKELTGLPIMKTNRHSASRTAIKYLTQFGYLPASDQEIGLLRSEEDVTLAIKTLQKFAHIPVTGNIDNATEMLMKKPRCGVSDVTSSFGRVKRYTAEGSKWPHTNLTWSLGHGPSGLDVGYLRKDIDAALRLWSKHSKLTFTETRSRDADILVWFYSGMHGDGYPFDGRGSVLAHAFFPGEGKGGDAHFDADETWVLSSNHPYSDFLSLYAVAAHEFGHSLGLSHSSDENALMYPWYRGDFVQGVPLPTDDLRGIQYLYGFKSPSRTPAVTQTSSKARPPVRTTTTSTTRSFRASQSTPRQRSRKPHTCDTPYDAITLIRGQLFIFRGPYFWRIGERGLEKGYPVKIVRFWPNLPANLTHVDAVYERPEDYKIVFFIGKHYWVFSGNYLTAGYPRPLTDLGLSGDVEKVDAAMVWGHNGKTYLFAETVYWRFDEKRRRVELDYPRDMAVWRGVPYYIDSVFQYKNGKTYFFKDRVFWEFSDLYMRVKNPTPSLSAPFWMGCPAKSTAPGSENQLSLLHSTGAASRLHLVAGMLLLLPCSLLVAAITDPLLGRCSV